jgi:hypothetical protein
MITSKIPLSGNLVDDQRDFSGKIVLIIHPWPDVGAWQVTIDN